MSNVRIKSRLFITLPSSSSLRKKTFYFFHHHHQTFSRSLKHRQFSWREFACGQKCAIIYRSRRHNWLITSPASTNLHTKSIGFNKWFSRSEESSAGKGKIVALLIFIIDTFLLKNAFQALSRVFAWIVWGTKPVAF